MFYKVLGPLLRTARKSAGLSQEEVAQRMGITNQNVSSWELGKSKIDMNQLLLLCSMYDIDFTDILLKASGKAESLQTISILKANVSLSSYIAELIKLTGLP